MPQYAYIHIPFCKRKCGYCSFTSFAKIELIPEYINKLQEEIKYFYKGEPLKTLYIGGGTPSLIKPDDVNRILSSFNINKSTEITMEANPESIDLEYLTRIKEAGINRLSIGVQSFNDDILKKINRLHRAEEAISKYNAARAAGFSNINLDFIYGLPAQTLEDFKKTITRAAELEPEHISLYGLKIENGSKFAKKKPANLPNEDLQADMYLSATDIMKKYGYEHYEFSNFSKPKKESLHNLNYWNNEEYYGFGVAAHGYTNGIRYANPTKLEEYLATPTKKASMHKLTSQEKLEEEIFLGFRKCSGINVEIINQKYNIDFEKKYKKQIAKYLETGHLIKTTNGYKLSIEGILLSNIILCEFL